MNLSLRMRGPEGARLVLFLHPFPLSASCWDDLLDRCARAGLRAVALDAPGFGGAPALGKPLEMDAIAALARDALDQLGAEKAALVGCSMGGYAALAFARLFPERLRALGLLCTKAGPDSPEAVQAREAGAEAALTHGPGAVAAQLAPKIFAPGCTIDPRPLFAQATAQGMADALRGMPLRPDSRPLLGQIRVPTLVIAGEFDQLMGDADTHGLAQGIPGAQLEVIPGAGHLAFLEKPELVAAPLLKLLLG